MHSTFIRLLLLLCGLCSLSCLAQEENTRHYFRTIDSRVGLSQNTVFQILQDRQGFMWFGTQHGLNRYEGTRFKVYKKDNSTLGRNFITALHEDRRGDIWVGTDGGLYIYHPQSDSFTDFNKLSSMQTEIQDLITAIQEDEQGNIWFSVENQGLFRYRHTDRQTDCLIDHSRPHANINPFRLHGETSWIALYGDNLYSFPMEKSQEWQPLRDATANEPFKGDIIYKHVEGLHNRMYIASTRGLTEVDRTSGRCRKLLNAFVRTVQFQDDETLWAGTEEGIYIYNLRTGRVSHIQTSSQEDRYALADNAIYSIYRDREQGMWVGSYFGGVNYTPYPWSYFEKYYPHEGCSEMGRRVREIVPADDGTLWIGTEDKGLFRFDPVAKQLMPWLPDRLPHNIHGICVEGQTLWVGSFSHGLYRLDLRTNRLKHYQKGEADNTLPANDIFSICRTSQNQIWLGTTSGLAIYDPQTDSFVRIPELQDKFVYHILEAADGNIWLATYSHGAYCYRVQSRTWHHYPGSGVQNQALPSNKLIGLFEDSDRQLWLLTLGEGVCRYRPESDDFMRCDTLLGVEGNIVYRMMEDTRGDLWCSTNNGLVCYHPSSNSHHRYTTANGLLNNQFNFQSGYADRQGRIYVGSIDGFVVFRPATFVENRFQPTVALTLFYQDNKQVTPHMPESPLKQSIVFLEDLSLKAHHNSFSLRVATLSYQAPLQNRVRYRLDGYDKEWNEQPSATNITYANLPPGRYRLHVKGINSDRQESANERILSIRILPPFYRTLWAYLAYALLLCGAGSYGVMVVRRKSQRRHRRAMEQLEHEKERELYTAKIEFFTNVAHEIRTPLTLIKSPLENVLSQPHLPGKMKEDLEIMDLNTNRLLVLVNQLLDFRKTEAHGFKLNFVQQDLVQLLLHICKRFRPQAEQQGKHFSVELPESLQASVDKEGLTKIISNLITNAIKYSNSYIRILLTHEGEMFRLEVHNDGPLVPPSMQEEIFKPFTRYNETADSRTTGTGIGLALARSLAELHEGTLQMDPQAADNCFVLQLPASHPDTISIEQTVSEGSDNTEEIAHEPQTEEGESDSDQRHRYSLLVVEDNPDMQAFLVRQLAEHYQVFTASDGLKALDVLKEQTIHLIISDIMMPRMDGLELCQHVKSETDYSHIPVLLLTAKTTLQARIEGLKLGADAYIEKPFSVEHLRVSIDNLMSNRDKLRNAFAHSPFVSTHTVALTKADEEFLKMLKEVITENMQNSDFSLDTMAEQLHMSRSSLNRKIKGLLDMTPNDYIRLVRLKKAAQLIKEGGCRINEVCYMTGFNTPSYFTKCFQKQFGVLPKEFATAK